MNILEKIDTGGATTEEALEIFDALEPVEVDFMLGSWKGEGFQTGHPLDGLLEAYHWHGKRFENTEHVHPLIFRTRRGGTALVNPRFLAPSLSMVDRFPIPRSRVTGRLFQIFMPLFSTSRSRARLRRTVYRGKLSATMIYDQLPINDVFCKIDDNTLFGVMDFKAMKNPFFFLLRREPHEA